MACNSITGDEPVFGVCLNTGRCATVSLSEYFSWNYSDLAFVWHEPFHESLLPPAVHFRRYDELKWSWDSEPPCTPKLERIRPFVKLWKQLLDSGKSVLVFGWTIYPFIPLLISAFPSAVRILHLVRHPVAVAASFTNNGMYDAYVERRATSMNVHLDPRVSRTFYPEYRDTWKKLSPFEKNLFRWAEINSYGDELKTLYPDRPFMRRRVEDISKDVLNDIAIFFGLPERSGDRIPNFNSQRNRRKSLRPIRDAFNLLSNHVHVIQLAESLGYNCSSESVRRIETNYDCPSGLIYSLNWFLYRFRHLRVAAASLKKLISRKVHKTKLSGNPLALGLASGCRQHYEKEINRTLPGIS